MGLLRFKDPDLNREAGAGLLASASLFLPDMLQRRGRGGPDVGTLSVSRAAGKTFKQRDQQTSGDDDTAPRERCD